MRVTPVDYQHIGDALVTLCQRAAAVILDVYHSDKDPRVTLKQDASPVTEADELSQEVIMEGLRNIQPEWPILSEELALPPFEERRQWSRYWLVDPLDGTREFIHRTDDFTINIALIEQGVAVLSVVGVPVANAVFLGIPGAGAYKYVDGDIVRLRVAACSRESVKVLTSRRHKSPALSDCIRRLQAHRSRVEIIEAGSALKFCLLAEGKADIYPRFAPCSEWDTAAGHALVEAAGGRVVDTGFRPLRYNTRRSVSSPHFYALGDIHVDWQALLLT